MKTLHVALGNRSYPIYIGKQLLNKADLLSTHIKGQQVMIVSNETVAPLYLDRVTKSLSAYEWRSVILPDGEQFKDLNHLNTIYDALLTHRFDRSCTLVALGGGVVGDMTGFAAATYQRGVNFIQIPTTLLAQVDSSVGGKTGVNHALGKNMIGAFYQPQAVIADTDTLNTLEDNQLSAGIAEVIKYGLIRDPSFFDWLEANMDKLLCRDQDTLAYAIKHSCQNKADVVAADEREAGERALLNLGHTFGHAIEAGMGYGSWLHGEAVAAGMSMAAHMSEQLGWINTDTVTRIDSVMQKANLPIRAPADLNMQQFLDLMAVDKKVKQGKINFVLLTAIGKAIVCADYDEQALQQTLQTHASKARPSK